MRHSLSARTRGKAVFARLCALALAFALAGLSAACGNRGSLYLPDQDPAEVTADAAIEAGEDEDEEDPRRRELEDIESDWP